MAARQKHSLELRERAVRMYRTTETKPQIKKLAVQLGMRPEALRGWIRQADRDVGERADGLTADEGAELVALRKETAQRRGSRHRRGTGRGQTRRRWAANRPPGSEMRRQLRIQAVWQGSTRLLARMPSRPVDDRALRPQGA